LARLFVTGGVRIEGPDGVAVDGDLPGNQGRVALVALAVERRALSRDELADIIWDDDPPAQWVGALNALISKLRGLLTSIGLDGKSSLVSEGGAHRLVVPDVWIDLEEGYRTLDRAEGAYRHDDLAAATGPATVASGILRRPILPGVDSRWVDDANRRREDASYRAFITLARVWLARGDAQLAATVAESAIAVDPYRELAYRLLVEAELQRGDHAAAQRHLERCRRILHDELGVGLSADTLALGERFERSDGHG